MTATVAEGSDHIFHSNQKTFWFEKDQIALI